MARLRRRTPLARTELGSFDNPPRSRKIPARPVTRLGVVGTDAGVGKTVVASAIITALRESGVRVAPMKPVGRTSGGDVQQMSAAAGTTYPMRLIQPIAFPDAAVPLVGSRRARDPIDVEVLDSAFGELCTIADAVVVEDSGGLLAPITETETFATMFSRWGLELVIVSPNRIGAVNQIMLTVRAAKSAALRIAAVVLTTLTRERGGTAERTNQALLKELLLTIPVISVPYSEAPGDPQQLLSFARELSIHYTIARPA